MKVEFGRLQEEEQQEREDETGVGLGLDSSLQLATPHPVARLQLLLLHHPCWPDQCMVAPQSFP